MSWSNVGTAVGRMAPMLGSLMAGRAGAVVGEAIAIAFGVPNTPEAVIEALNRPNASVVLKQLQYKNKERLWDLYLNHDRVITEAEVGLALEVNRTMQAEAGKEHGFYRGWRPFFGYAVAVTFLLNIGIMPALLIWFRPLNMPQFIAYITATVVIWPMAFGVLGVYVHKRSQDKQLRAGLVPTSTIDAGRVAKLTKDFHNNVSN